ncbi:sphingosine-1-phosphate phosphatase 1 [Protopterus annectens]|uniref:sphingosine-1-phosphate phosphatase 1 n=1 Tax=Protopterus annectens TaxID=7888 RepID=UPI001CFC1FE4|nr:sphingosine-1-phosphate phosphatase 1 [Protopterus annectens]
MKIIEKFVQVCNYLQDPYKVSWFQQICGVETASLRGDQDEHEQHLCNGINRFIEKGKQEEEDGPIVRHRPSIKSDIAKSLSSKNGVINVCDHMKSCAGDSGSDLRKSTADNHSFGSETLGKGPEQSDGLTVDEKMKPLRRNSLTEEDGQAFSIKCKTLYFLFTLGTELGNELFYISFFPFWIWNVDAYVARRIILIWVWVMYLGQCTKDILRWPRPPSPPVVKVEVFYNSEYSMPSTHAMSGTAIPISLLLLTYGRWQYPFIYGLLLALCWCSLVCLSRIYMGMHTVLDVIVGVLYAVLILIVFHPALDFIDNFNLTYRYAPLIIISLHLSMGLFSFTLDTWSTSRGDTAQILGSGAGIACASHVNYRFGFMPDPTPDMLPFIPPSITLGLLAKSLLKFCIGVVIVVLTRAVMKKITIPLACKILHIPSDDLRKARQRMEVELPYRYITYGTVGFSSLFLVPRVLYALNLS